MIRFFKLLELGLLDHAVQKLFFIFGNSHSNCLNKKEALEQELGQAASLSSSTTTAALMPVSVNLNLIPFIFI